MSCDVDQGDISSFSVLFLQVVVLPVNLKKKSVLLLIAVITVEPADKISFVYNCMQTRVKGQCNGNDPLASFVCQDRW